MVKRREINVSYYTGNIDWAEMKEAGVDFVMIRAGYGAGAIDLLFRRNAEECMRAGIPFGVYWYSFAYTAEMAEKEAEAFAETTEEFTKAKLFGIAYGKASIRYAQTRGFAMTETKQKGIVKAFCRRAEKLGYKVTYLENVDFRSKDS